MVHRREADSIVYPVAMFAGAGVALALFAWRRWHRLPTLAVRDRSFALIPLLLFIVIIISQFLGVRIVGAIAGIDAESMELLTISERARVTTILMMGGYLGGTPALFAAIWWQRKLRARGARRPAPILSALLMGGATLALAWPVVASTGIVAQLIEEAATGTPSPDIAHSTLQMLMSPEVRESIRWALIGLVVCIAPVFEEVIYRGLVQESIKRFTRSRWIAIIATSALFAIVHLKAVPPSALAALFFLSLAFGWIYEKSGSLIPSIVAHVGFNAMNIILAFATKAT